MNSNIYCLILAGGVGNRLWPISNKTCPKQFTDILYTGKSLIRQTYERIHHLIPEDRIYVITGKEYADMVREQIPEIPLENIIKEPCRRNTATSIMYAATKIKKVSKDATMLVVPSDNFISNDLVYLKDIKEGIEFVKSKKGLLIVGIKPTRVETQYGYIQVKDRNTFPKISTVKTFTEKPNRELAQTFFDSGDFLWNAGMFIWKVQNVIDEIKKYMYDLYVLFKDDTYLNTDKEQEFVDHIYGECPNISIDFGVLEKSSDVFVLKGDFGWSDTSTWHTYHNLCPKDEHNNANPSEHIVFQDAQNCTVSVPVDKKVIVCGIKDVIIAENGNTLMVCNKDNEEQIKLFEKRFKR